MADGIYIKPGTEIAIDDINVSSTKVYSSSKVENRLTSKIDAINGIENEIIVFDTLNKIKNSGKKITDFSPISHTHSGANISLSTVNFGAYLNASIDNVQKFAEYLDNNGLGVATSIVLDTTNFDNNLSATENTVQKAIDFIDNMSIGDMYKAVYDPQNIQDDAFDRTNHTGIQNTGTITPENTIGTPAHITDLSKMLSYMWSATITDGGVLTDNLDGSVGIAAGELSIRATDSGHEPLYVGPFTGNIALALTDNDTNYIYVDYNAGTPIVAVTLDPTAIDLTTKVPMYVVVREGTEVSYLDVLDDGIDFMGKTRKMWFFTEKFKRVDGGSVVSESGTRNLACTAGSFFFGNNELFVPAIDTSTAGTFEYYRKISGAWVETNATQFDNLQYNNLTTPGAETLATLDNSKYAVHYVYVIINNPSHYAVVYSQDQYNTLAAAEAAPLPTTLPPSIQGIGQLLGRFIIQKNETSGLMETVWTTSFSSAQATEHNGLAGLQGGTILEYYHLTLAEHTIATQAASATLSGYVNTSAQTFAGVKTLTNPVINVTSDATGDIYYRNASGLFTRLPIGTAGQVLTQTAGLPAWEDASGGGASFTGINGQSLSIAGEVSSIEGIIGELTAFDSGNFAEMQISTLTRTSGTLTITVKKNGTAVGTATITSATTVTNGRYFGTSTDLADAFVANDVITIEVSDTGTGSNNLVVNLK